MKPDTPRLARPLSATDIATLKRAKKRVDLPFDTLWRQIGVSRAALFRALAGQSVLQRTRVRVMVWARTRLMRKPKAAAA